MENEFIVLAITLVFVGALFGFMCGRSYGKYEENTRIRKHIINDILNASNLEISQMDMPSFHRGQEEALRKVLDKYVK